MLNPQELRYGNNIYSPEGQMITVTFQTFASMHEAEKGLKPHGFSAIPLNNNLLSKLGFFEKELPPFYSGGKNGFQKWVGELEKRTLLLTGTSAYIASLCNGDDIFRGTVIDCFITEVHCLQNLYYAVCGLELPSL